mmetsp:Transcript_42114/g.133744  ORF Transcript_42114/g.133744 Transcript_42114/m.133744 type:complete len:202 (+) Transcript_42114:437-1042(+)
MTQPRPRPQRAGLGRPAQTLPLVRSVLQRASRPGTARSFCGPGGGRPPGACKTGTAGCCCGAGAGGPRSASRAGSAEHGCGSSWRRAHSARPPTRASRASCSRWRGGRCAAQASARSWGWRGRWSPSGGRPGPCRTPCAGRSGTASSSRGGDLMVPFRGKSAPSFLRPSSRRCGRQRRSSRPRGCRGSSSTMSYSRWSSSA